MNTKNQSKLKMYLTLRVYLLSNPAVTAKLPDFPEFLAALDAAILQIQNHSEQRQVSSKGVTDNKKLLRESLIALTVDASSKMQAYAKYVHNTVLLAEIKFKGSELRDIPSLELVDITRGLYNRIDAHLPEVTVYGLSPSSQLEYREAIDDFAISISQPRESQLKGKENSLLEEQGFEKGDATVDYMDIVVEDVHRIEPIFYAGYKNARKIVERGSGSLQVQGTVTEAATDKPIAGATLIFRCCGQTAIILEKETASKGGFMIKSLAEGIYNVTVTKVGFQTQIISVVVNCNELCDVQVKMEKV
jgi:hypothetical protein